jgi:hypothetical protein
MRKRKNINKDLLLAIVIVIFVTIFLKAFLYDLLPPKYFYDSKHILGAMNGTATADKSYVFVANIFRFINIFNFSSISQWGWLMSLIFIPILIFVITRRRQYSLVQYIFILSSVVLLDIYVFGLTKDIIQFLFFLLLYIVLKTKMKNITKLILCCLILLYEALNFRVYYAIMAMIMINIFIIYIFFIKNKKLNKQIVFKIIILSLIMFFAEVFILQFISRDNYISILYARLEINIQREAIVDASTMINDLLGPNTNYIMFIGNYIINIFRLMVPVELLLKSIKYIPFIVYQIFITYQIIKSFTKINDNSILWIITTISFMMISVIFEPDFGSFIRHESALILILLELTNINYDKMEMNNNEKN